MTKKSVQYKLWLIPTIHRDTADEKSPKTFQVLLNKVFGGRRKLLFLAQADGFISLSKNKEVSANIYDLSLIGSEISSRYASISTRSMINCDNFHNVWWWILNGCKSTKVTSL